jgi:hypothetical protein
MVVVAVGDGPCQPAVEVRGGMDQMGASPRSDFSFPSV